MKRIHLATLVFFSVLLIACGDVGKRSAPIPLPQMETITSRVYAHQGGKEIDGYAENSLRTMQYLHGKYPRMMHEIDLQLTSDKKLVLFHDDGLDRLTGKSGKIEHVDYETLASLPLYDYKGEITECQIPLFEDVLSWASNENVTLWLDFKPSAKYEDVISMVREYNAEKNVVLISYNTGQARKLASLAPEMIVSVTARNMEEWNALIDSDINLDKTVVFTGTRLSDKNLLDAIHERELLAVLGTLGNLDNRAAARGDKLYQQWVEEGYDLFSSDRPEAIWHALYED